MTIESHAYQQRHHYEALKNPAYQIEGLQEVLWEEAMMNMPIIPTPHNPEPPVVKTTNISLASYEQQRRLLLHLQETVNQLQFKRKKQLNKYNEYNT